MTTDDDAPAVCADCELPEDQCECVDICGTCNGCGDGRWPGSRCCSCRGKGEFRRNPPERDPDADREEMRERRAEEAREQRIFNDE